VWGRPHFPTPFTTNLEPPILPMMGGVYIPGLGSSGRGRGGVGTHGCLRGRGARRASVGQATLPHTFHCTPGHHHHPHDGGSLCTGFGDQWRWEGWGRHSCLICGATAQGGQVWGRPHFPTPFTTHLGTPIVPMMGGVYIPNLVINGGGRGGGGTHGCLRSHGARRKCGAGHTFPHLLLHTRAPPSSP
jgi:hypothetical protein